MSHTPEKPLAADIQIYDDDAVAAELAQGASLIAVLRKALADGDAILRQCFAEGAPAAELVPWRAALMDRILNRAWESRLGAFGDLSTLVAVGGYGRGELHPGSDVDVLVLIRPSTRERLAEAVEAFIAALWDLGLDVGHSVRTVPECEEAAGADVTIATNLMESRRIAGSADLFHEMREVTGHDRVWPSRTFFQVKLAEQQARHDKYHDTAYNLEPNIKASPGGLRDIQMVGWVAKRHFGADRLHDLVKEGFLTEAEYQALYAGQCFLWDVRFALHTLAGRREDRLLFDHQIALAGEFGYSDKDGALAVEQFMQRYFRTVMELSRLNEMLLQLFAEVILYAEENETPVPINKRFQARKGFLEVAHRHVFRDYPFALLEVFLLLEQHPELKGVRAATIRLIRQHRTLIDERFRRDMRARTLFMEILRQPQGITHALRRMHRYGVLGRYIPAFGRITGRMQYDLFHVYTVDSHTLFVVRNLRRMAIPEHRDELPLAHTVMTRVRKPELIFLAALFHDIAKGRGGDHSELGARDAYEFAIQHGLGAYDARLVSWLVLHHLAMSMTAQRKDLSDPQVITDFARLVGDQIHLDCIYLVTVADIRATNPELWNSWRAALLDELYTLTRRALRRGLGNPVDKPELVREAQSEARRLLYHGGIGHAKVREIWQRLPDDYFLRHTPREIAWHTEAVAATGDADLPLVVISADDQRGGTVVFLYARDNPHLFARSVSALDRLGLDIQDARIITTECDYTLISYMVLDSDGEPVDIALRAAEIREAIRAAIADHTGEAPQPPAARRLPRQLRHFQTRTQITFSDDPQNQRTALEIITADRPGLLARVGQAFSDCKVRVKNAKISTIGERAEDVFFITDEDGRPLLAPEQFRRVRERLRALLDEEAP